MTVTEFSNEFDIAYNGIATNSAPPLDLYEKSIYLTRAQLEIINNYFNPLGNKYKDGFEQSSKRRSDLNELVQGAKSTTIIASSNAISDNSTFFRIPNKTYIIIQEKALVKDTTCKDGKYIKVKPVTHDEYNIQEENPFKKPDSSVIWRLDYFSQTENNKNVELISTHDLTEYKFRYVAYPSPIILGDLLALFPNETLSIDGITQEQTCSLSESIHREILNRAVEMATADYKPQNLAVKAQMNNRNE